jgi:hypothetical protein
MTYSPELDLLSVDLALREPWHLSYPFLFSSGQDHLMLPEARQSGRLTLYRAHSFPLGWKAELTIPVPPGAVDATPLFWNDKWWLFYCVKRTVPERTNELHLSFADALGGPWKPHALNPVLKGLANGRPGGSPIAMDDHICLPVQDCRKGYGGSLRRLRITLLDETRFEADDQPWLHAPAAFAPFDQGLHTLSSSGPVSLIDLKRIDRSPMARALNRWTRNPRRPR